MRYEYTKRFAKSLIDIAKMDNVSKDHINYFLQGFAVGCGYKELPEKRVVYNILNFYTKDDPIDIDKIIEMVYGPEVEDKGLTYGQQYGDEPV